MQIDNKTLERFEQSLITLEHVKWLVMCAQDTSDELMELSHGEKRDIASDMRARINSLLIVALDYLSRAEKEQDKLISEITGY